MTDSDLRCLIWATDLTWLGRLNWQELREPVKDGVNVTSDRAGGKYFISKSAIGEIRNFSVQEKILLTDWLIEQRKYGEERPEITSEQLKMVRTRQEKTIDQRAEALLRWLKDNTEKIGDSFWLKPESSECSRKEDMITMAATTVNQNWEWLA